MVQKKVVKKGITAHPYVKQVMSEQEKPKKKFLDKPVRDIFSFNVEKEIKDNADRSRNVVNNFGRQGITIIPKKRLHTDDQIKLSIIILAALFAAITIPSVVVKAIAMIIAGVAGTYWVTKRLEARR